MPLSEFGWSDEKVFQVYGTKRKHEWDNQVNTDVEVNAAAKRQCCQPSESGDGMNEMLEINHNSIPPQTAPQQMNQMMDMGDMNMNQLHKHHQLTQQHQMATKEQFMSQPQNHPIMEAPTHTPQTEVHSSQDGNTMVMDLCDETYSHVELDKETQSMYSEMDSDCVPNLQQYGGGERSPTSSRIRCFCKPQWEGMLDMRPYVSDYY